MKKSLFFVLTFMLISNLAFAELVQGTGRKTVTAAGTAEALSATATSFSTLGMCAETDNTGVMTIGNSGTIGTLGTRVGIPLAAGACYTISLSRGKLGNLSSIYVDSTVNGDGITFYYFQEI